MSADPRADFVYMAKLAEQAERYDEMVENMKNVATAGQDLTVEERNLLSVAYKNVIGARRASWRIVSSIEQREESKGHAAQVEKIKAYREKIELNCARFVMIFLKFSTRALFPRRQAANPKFSITR